MTSPGKAQRGLKIYFSFEDFFSKLKEEEQNASLARKEKGGERVSLGNKWRMVVCLVLLVEAARDLV